MKIKVEKAGVVEIVDGTMYVNSDDILDEAIRKAVGTGVKRNYHGSFAARVCIEIEILGDLEGGKDG